MTKKKSITSLFISYRIICTLFINIILYFVWWISYLPIKCACVLANTIIFMLNVWLSSMIFQHYTVGWVSTSYCRTKETHLFSFHLIPSFSLLPFSKIFSTKKLALMTLDILRKAWKQFPPKTEPYVYIFFSSWFASLTTNEISWFFLWIFF